MLSAQYARIDQPLLPEECLGFAALDAAGLFHRGFPPETWHPRCQGRFRRREFTGRGLSFQRSFVFINIRGRGYSPRLKPGASAATSLVTIGTDPPIRPGRVV